MTVQKNQNNPVPGDKGQTLVEVVVATGMVTLVLVTIVSGVVLSVRNTRFAKQQALGVRYSQEGLEWIRRQRDELGWGPFYSLVSADGDPVVYCLNTLPSSTTEFSQLSAGECASGSVVGTTDLSRQAIVDLDTDTAEVTVEVSWSEGGRDHTSQVKGQLSAWEQ